MPERAPTNERPRVVAMGEVFLPFEQAAQFLTDNLDGADREIITVLESPIILGAINGSIVVSARNPSTFAGEKTTPLGAAYLEKFFDGNSSTVLNTPVFIGSRFTIKSYAELKRLKNSQMVVNLGQNELFYLDCAAAAPPRIIVPDGIYDTGEFELPANFILKNYEGKIPVLPWSLEQLKTIQVVFLPKAATE